MKAEHDFQQADALLTAKVSEETDLDLLFEAVYVELRRLATAYMRDERPEHTLQTTALVHEAYVRLAGGQPIDWQNRAQFFTIASQVMRNILVDYARRHSADKRGGGVRNLSLDEAFHLAVAREVDLLRLDEALRDLYAVDEEQARIVELRFFVGLTIEQIATVLEVSEMTVSRRWKTAKLWLHKAMS